MDVLTILQGIDGYISVFDHVLINNLFCLALAVSALLNRKDANTLFIISVVLFPKLFDILFLNDFLLLGVIPNYSFYLFNSICDGLVLWLILYRELVVRWFLTLKIKADRYLNNSGECSAVFSYARHINEFKIIALLAIGIFINLVVAAEYPVRWNINKDFLYFYYSYPTVKLVQNIAEVFLLFTLGSATLKTVKE